jgi:aminoglycoside phosphotransferase (APT) family kinase protein
MTDIDDTATGASPEAHPRPQTSTRDRAELREGLVRWFVDHLPPGAHPQVSDLGGPSQTGMSSETLLFEVVWRQDGETRAERCAARLRPEPGAMPVFPSYDLERQFRVMRLTGERTAVPVPRTLWFEPSEQHLGSPFFVMERVDGEVPPDIMPYPFGSWLSEAAPADQQRLQRSAVRVLTELHGMDASREELAFLASDAAGDSDLRRHVNGQAAYYEWVAEGVRHPLIERAFAWLENHWPDDEGDTVVSWGDSRIGNIIFRDFEPVAVLDWEMAALGPREIDLGWFIFLHRFFQDLAESAGLPGMPQFLRREDVAATYEQLSGHAPRDLDFYSVYAALRHAIVMSRVTRRAIHFGEAEMPEDPDDLISHRQTLEAMLEGTYWNNL